MTITVDVRSVNTGCKQGITPMQSGCKVNYFHSLCTITYNYKVS